jgi:hypothetical protein
MSDISTPLDTFLQPAGHGSNQVFLRLFLTDGERPRQSDKVALTFTDTNKKFSSEEDEILFSTVHLEGILEPMQLILVA